MSTHRRKWITAGLLAASLGFWAAAFIAPGLGLDRDDVSDCRGLGVMTGGALLAAMLVCVAFGPRIRRVEQRQDDQDAAWCAWREERGGQDPGRLRPVSGRSA